jgi:hypothetical protein
MGQPGHGDAGGRCGAETSQAAEAQGQWRAQETHTRGAAEAWEKYACCAVSRLTMLVPQT